MPGITRRRESPDVWGRRLAFLLHASVAGALAVWVRSLSPAAGVVAAVLLIVIGIGALREQRSADVVAFAGLAAATGVIVGLNARALHTASLATTSPQLISRPIELALADEIRHTQRRLIAAATSAAGGTSVRAALPDLDSEAGLIVFNGESTEWAGRTVVPVEGLWETDGIVVTPFYIVQYSADVAKSRRAVALSVVHAKPPADRLTRALTTGFGGSLAVRFDVTDATIEPDAQGTIVQIGGSRLAVRATVRDAAAYAAGVEQSARTHAAAILLLATIASLAVLLRSAERLWDRIAAVGIPMAVIAITPLNQLSNVTRLFDASTYYVSGGGPYTASVGALAMASALVLFVVMASVRVRMPPRRRWSALFAVFVVAGAAPYLLRYLARGINLPPSGTTTALWLAWEVALFLAATSFLTAGVAAGQGALGAKRGLPLWVAPTLASIAALLGPALLGDDGAWPKWYPALWVAAIGALVLARRSRAVLISSAFVAACGATVLLWGATIRERVRLASRDVSQLGMVEVETHTLLDRLASDALQGDPPNTHERLLARFASADLAATDYPVALAFWPVDSVPLLLSIRGGVARQEVEALVADARRAGAPLSRQLPSTPGAAVALAVPYSGGGVFTAVVESRARLSRIQTFPDLFGLWEVTPNPPYQLTMAPVSTSPDSTAWQRLGSHLHAELSVASGVGGAEMVRVRANVTFDPYESLVPIGLLVVLFDLVIVGILIGADLIAGGVLGRWIRMRRNRWRRSYRLQLTFALFAFFIVPALAFALWSYRRIHADDRSARELLVREALRRARDSSGVIVDIPMDVPHFIYTKGQLTDVSDSLLFAVAPTGHWLDPRVQRLLGESDQIVATTPIRVGKSDLLFGFRALSKDLVAAVPARNDEVTITKRRSDLGVLVVLATVLGGVAALALSGVAARKLARPIGALRAAALAVAGGSREPLGSTDAPAEFVPVFRAFDRMARDLAASEAQLTRAERVLAWGEMARQVAHEIKNPLTPIRLGVQHLLRAWRDGRPDFDTILEENSSRLLREIDHLDATARSFSRFGTMPDAPAPPEMIDIAAVVRDVVSLEGIGADNIEWRVSGADEPSVARARSHELREVLLNLCENARNAFARVVDVRLEKRGGRIVLSVVDDGEGVPRQLHARVFEPHFSTRTSGSGLGLAISRQLVESWGGSIDLYSEPALGTTVRIVLDAGK
jgi:signal transduction histidine kinase